MPGSSSRSFPPQLGPRGEGWVVLQTVLIVLVIAAQLTSDRGTTWWEGAILAAGAALLVWSAWALGPALSPFPRPRPGVVRVRRGPYGLVPHPMYASVIVMCAAASLRAPWAWVPTAALAAVFAAKARLESRWLRQAERAG